MQLSPGQLVLTKYGPAAVVCVSQISSNVYVRVPARAQGLYVFPVSELQLLVEADTATSPPVDSGKTANKQAGDGYTASQSKAA